MTVPLLGSGARAAVLRFPRGPPGSGWATLTPGGLDEETPRHRGEGHVREQAETGVLQLDSPTQSRELEEAGPPCPGAPEERGPVPAVSPHFWASKT